MLFILNASLSLYIVPPTYSMWLQKSSKSCLHFIDRKMEPSVVIMREPARAGSSDSVLDNSVLY